MKYTTCHHELERDEVWLGNAGVQIPDIYKELKSIRLGHQAYCINGNPLSRDLYRPLIIKKSEEPEYDKIYLSRMEAINRW